jgi:hypothetical protein
MTGMINDDTGMIGNSTGMINDDTGMIGNSTGMINDDTGMRKPRNFPLPTIKNLPQFRDKSHQEVREYILEKKGVDIGGNFNLGSIIMPILIVSAIVAGGYGLYWLIKQFQKRRETQSENKTYE